MCSSIYILICRRFLLLLLRCLRRITQTISIIILFCIITSLSSALSSKLKIVGKSTDSPRNGCRLGFRSIIVLTCSSVDHVVFKRSSRATPASSTTTTIAVTAATRNFNRQMSKSSGHSKARTWAVHEDRKCDYLSCSGLGEHWSAMLHKVARGLRRCMNVYGVVMRGEDAAASAVERHGNATAWCSF